MHTPDASLQTSLLIDAQARPSSSGKTFTSINPVTKSTASIAAAATLSDANSATSSAAAAFAKWSTTGPSTRREILFKAADILEQRSAELENTMRVEIGATTTWSKLNTKLAAAILRDCASLTTHIKGQCIPTDTPGMTAFSIRKPVGIVLAIAPWNAPLILGVRAIAAPLACANCVVLKSSELCPHTHRLIGDVLLEAGLPAGVLNVISNAPEDASQIVESLIANPAIRRVSFTGSTRVGREVAGIAAKYLKPALLELGGKAPLIVLEDADLEKAAQAAVFGAFMNQGQICMSTERLIVHENIADEFIEILTGLTKPLIAGDPNLGTTPLGPVIGTEAVLRLKSLIADAVSKGAKVIAGGHSRGIYMDATLIDCVTPSMRIYAEESFGPVAAIIRAGNADEALRIANDTEYGLSAAIYSQDFTTAMNIAMRIDSGICHINAPTVHDEPQMPFGGTKNSGYGRFGGTAAIDEFTETRWITFTDNPGDYPI